MAKFTRRSYLKGLRFDPSFSLFTKKHRFIFVVSSRTHIFKNLKINKYRH